jgi:hypothetical protein
LSRYSSWFALQSCQKAIHVRTGDRGTDGAVSAWLERHGVEVVACVDAFEACTLALTQGKPEPDLAFIGADWLAPDETALIGYLRETWPQLTTVIYGSAQATARFEARPPTLVCRSAEGLRRMLASPPDALRNKSRAAAQSQRPLDNGWRPQPKASAPAVQGRTPRGTPLPHSTIQTRDAEMLAAELARRGPQPDAHETVDARPPASHEILTREELAALLADDEE